jgi:hypothetical protein
MPQLGEDCADTTTGGATWCDSGRPVLMIQFGSLLQQRARDCGELDHGGVRFGTGSRFATSVFRSE